MKVKVYTTPTCPWCKVAKQYLEDKKIEFEEYNVAIDHDKAIEMVNKSGQRSVPVLDIDGNIIIGFDKEAINKIIKK